MSLETDIIAGRGGFLTNTPQKQYLTGSGYAPYLWYGDDAVTGTAEPWLTAPIGSIYGYKPSESTEVVFYAKGAAAGATADWKIISTFNMGGAWKIKKIPITTKDGTEIDTGFDLPAKGILYDVYVDVTTAEATGTTKTIDVGLLSSESGGDADGFLDGVVTSAIALKTGALTVTDGSSQNFYAASPTWGVLMYSGRLGTDAAGDAGVLIKRPYMANSVTAKSISYTVGSAATELAGSIYLVYAELGL